MASKTMGFLSLQTGNSVQNMIKLTEFPVSQQRAIRIWSSECFMNNLIYLGVI